MKKQSVRVFGNNYVQVVEDNQPAKGEGRFVVEDLVKGAVLARFDDYNSAQKMYMTKSQEYIQSSLDDSCTIKGMTVGDFIQSLEALPREATVEFSVSYDHSQNKLTVCN